MSASSVTNATKEETLRDFGERNRVISFLIKAMALIVAIIPLAVMAVVTAVARVLRRAEKPKVALSASASCREESRADAVQSADISPRELPDAEEHRVAVGTYNKFICELTEQLSAGLATKQCVETKLDKVSSEGAGVTQKVEQAESGPEKKEYPGKPEPAIDLAPEKKEEPKKPEPVSYKFPGIKVVKVARESDFKNIKFMEALNLACQCTYVDYNRVWHEKDPLEKKIREFRGKISEFSYEESKAYYALFQRDYACCGHNLLHFGKADPDDKERVEGLYSPEKWTKGNLGAQNMLLSFVGGRVGDGACSSVTQYDSVVADYMSHRVVADESGDYEKKHLFLFELKQAIAHAIVGELYRLPIDVKEFTHYGAVHMDLMPKIMGWHDKKGEEIDSPSKLGVKMSRFFKTAIMEKLESGKKLAGDALKTEAEKQAKEFQDEYDSMMSKLSYASKSGELKPLFQKLCSIFGDEFNDNWHNFKIFSAYNNADLLFDLRIKDGKVVDMETCDDNDQEKIKADIARFRALNGEEYCLKKDYWETHGSGVEWLHGRIVLGGDSGEGPKDLGLGAEDYKYVDEICRKLFPFITYYVLNAQPKELSRFIYDHFGCLIDGKHKERDKLIIALFQYHVNRTCRAAFAENSFAMIYNIYANIPGALYHAAQNCLIRPRGIPTVIGTNWELQDEEQFNKKGDKYGERVFLRYDGDDPSSGDDDDIAGKPARIEYHNRVQRNMKLIYGVYAEADNDKTRQLIREVREHVQKGDLSSHKDKIYALFRPNCFGVTPMTMLSLGDDESFCQVLGGVSDCGLREVIEKRDGYGWALKHLLELNPEEYERCKDEKGRRMEFLIQPNQPIFRYLPGKYNYDFLGMRSDMQVSFLKPGYFPVMSRGFGSDGYAGAHTIDCRNKGNSRNDCNDISNLRASAVSSDAERTKYWAEEEDMDWEKAYLIAPQCNWSPSIVHQWCFETKAQISGDKEVSDVHLLQSGSWDTTSGGFAGAMSREWPEAARLLLMSNRTAYCSVPVGDNIDSPSFERYYHPARGVV